MTWLGDILSNAFIDLWRKLWHTWEKDGDGGAFGKFTGAMLPEYPPFEQIEHALRGASVRFNDATWQLIGGIGRQIGDKTVGKIDEGVNKAIADAKAKVDEARRYIETNLIAPMKTTIEDAKAKLQKLGIDMDSLDIELSKGMHQIVIMQGHIGTFKSNIDAFASEIDSFRSKLTTLNEEEKALKVEVSDIQASISSFSSKLDSFDSRLTDLNSLASDLETAMSKAKNEIESVKERVRALEEKKEVPKLLPELKLTF